MKSRKPNRTQRSILKLNDLDTYTWYVQKDTPTEMQVVNVNTGEVKMIPKVK